MSIMSGLVQARSDEYSACGYPRTGWFGPNGWSFVLEAGIAVWALAAVGLMAWR